MKLRNNAKIERVVLSTMPNNEDWATGYVLAQVNCGPDSPYQREWVTWRVYTQDMSILDAESGNYFGVRKGSTDEAEANIYDQALADYRQRAGFGA